MPEARQAIDGHWVRAESTYLNRPDGLRPTMLVFVSCFS